MGQILPVNGHSDHRRFGTDLKEGIRNLAVKFVSLLGANDVQTISQFLKCFRVHPLPPRRLVPLIGMGPHVIAFLDEITKTVPLHLPLRNGAAQPDLPVSQGQDFPISLTGPTFNEYLLSNLKRIGLENENLLGFTLSI
jgi:hypothetical protein